jgi:hypothetical protein
LYIFFYVAVKLQTFLICDQITCYLSPLPLYITAFNTRWSLLGLLLARQHFTSIINVYSVSTVAGDLCEMDIELFRYMLSASPLTSWPVHPHANKLQVIWS